MIYPNLIRHYDNINGAPLPVLRRYSVLYSVTDATGQLHTGGGVVESIDLKAAYIYAMRLLRAYTPECAGYTGHGAKVSEIDE